LVESFRAPGNRAPPPFPVERAHPRAKQRRVGPEGTRKPDGPPLPIWGAPKLNRSRIFNRHPRPAKSGPRHTTLWWATPAGPPPAAVCPARKLRAICAK